MSVAWSKYVISPVQMDIDNNQWYVLVSKVQCWQSTATSFRTRGGYFQWFSKFQTNCSNLILLNYPSYPWNNQQKCHPDVLTVLIAWMTNHPLAHSHHTTISLQTSNCPARLQCYTYLLICHHFIIHMTLHRSTNDLLQGSRQCSHGCLGYLSKTLMKSTFHCLRHIKLKLEQNGSHLADNIFISTSKMKILLC